MKKRLRLSAGLFLTGIAAMYAAAPAAPELTVSEAAKAVSSAVRTMSPQAVGLSVQDVAADASVLRNETTLAISRYAQAGGYGSFSVAEGPITPELKPQEAPASLSAAPIVQNAPGMSRAGKITVDSYVAIDHSYRGNDMSASMTITKVEGSENQYTMSNIYDTDHGVTMTVDLAAGTVDIPAQVMYTHSTYGDVMFCPMTFTIENGVIKKMSYSKTGSVKGTIDEEGNISLGGWGLLFTSNPTYEGRGFNFMLGSDWKASKLKAKGKKQSGNGVEDVEYSIYIDQTGENTARIYCLAGVNGDVLLARVNPDKTITIAPQQIYNNLMYGPFFIYPAAITADNKVAVNSKGSVTGRWVSDNEIDFGSWVIAARVLPSQYVGYFFQDIKVNGPHGVKYPAAGKLEFAGAGSQTDPYLIKTFSDVNNLAKLVSGGNSFEGKYFTLANDLNLSGVDRENYIPVGNGNCPFQGTFDGGNHTIINFSLDGLAETYAGFFGLLGEKSTVKNLKFKGARVYNLGENAGVLSGLTYGQIDNITLTSCAVQGGGELVGVLTGGATKLKVGDNWLPSVISNVKVQACTATGVGSVAGVAGQSGSDIINCSVSGTFEMTGYISDVSKDVAGITGALTRAKISNCYAGGIVNNSGGYASAGGLVGRTIGAEIENSYSAAWVRSTVANTEKQPYAGGLTGYCSDSKVTNCFNGGSVVQTGASPYTGGLTGYLAVGYSFSSNGGASMINRTYFTNCFNYSQVVSPYNNPKQGLYGDTFISGSWTGAHPEDVCFSNSYYDAQIQTVREDKYGRDTRWFISGTLPQGLDASVWTAAQGRYPSLKALAGTQAADLAITPLILREGDTASKIKVGFDVTANNNLDWLIYYNDKLATDTEALKLENNHFTVKQLYANVTIQGLAKDGTAGKVYNFSLVPKLFDGEGTAESPYLLKNLQDWKNLDYAVGTVRQSHKDDCFAMANDIDFNYTDEFHGVGYGNGAAARFAGHLDGRNHTVHKLRVNAPVIDKDKDGKDFLSATKSIPYVGLIGVLDAGGSVKNVNIAADCDFLFYTYSAPVVGASLGEISNCRNYADVRSANNYCGGITSLVGKGGVVSDCYNAGSIISPYLYMGGIAGVTNGGALVKNCQNDGDLIAKAVIEGFDTGIRHTFGGIVGQNLATVENCVNNGTVNSNYNAGGIVGVNNSNYEGGIIRNCVNNGFVDLLSASTYRGGIVGVRSTDPVIEGNYYDASINVNGAAENQDIKLNYGLSTTELTSGQALEGLDASLFDFKAGAYPVLKKFASEAKTVALRSLYVKFAPKQVRTNIRKDVELSSAQGSKFELKVNDNFKLAGGKLTVELPADTKVAADTLTASLSGVVKSYVLSSIPAILKGEGSVESPYLIETPEDWNKLADFMEDSKWEYSGSNFRVVNDLDFKGDSIRTLAVDGTNFQATLDGNRRTIKNYVYSNTNQIKTRLTGPNFYVGRYIGVAIGSLGASGVMKDLTFEGSFKGNQNVAGVVGENFGIVDNIVNRGTVDNSTSNAVAGVVYRANPGSKVLNCVFEGKVKAYASYAAGIVYEVGKNAVVDKCVNRGEVSAASSGAAGIAYYNDGLISNCVNEGKINPAKGIASGICHMLRVDGSLENCVNKADIDLGTTNGTLYGIWGQFSISGNTTPATGHITGCYNTGNLSAKDNVYGVCGEIFPGVTVSDCYNTGDITAYAGVAAGFGKTAGKNVKFEGEALVKNCYNAGQITGAKVKCAGLFYEATYNSHITDSYNLGDITFELVPGTNGKINYSLGGGGLCGTVSQSKIERCFNAGNLTTNAYSVGGLAGYVANSTVDYFYNLGNITTTYPEGNTNGVAGGLTGYFSTAPNTLNHCYNMGTITAPRRVGGLSGGSFSHENVVLNSYNAGKVICLEENEATDGKMYKFWSGTVYTGSLIKNDHNLFEGYKNVYYDKTVNPGTQFRNIPGSGKTTKELAEMEMDGDFVKTEGGYPVMKFFAEKFKTDDISRSMLVLTNANENFEFVTDPFTLIAPADAEWTAIDPATGIASTALTIKDGVAKPMADANVLLTVASKDGKFHKDFILVLKPSQSSNIDTDFSGKEIREVIYFDLQGRQTVQPQAGQVYIVRTVYTDGSMQVTKALVRE